MNEFFAQIVCHLQARPSHGFIGGVLSFITGIAPTLEQTNMDIITSIFQIGAFTVSIVVGCLTIYAQFLKIQDRIKNRRNPCSR
jgi:hypothetical protein